MPRNMRAGSDALVSPRSRKPQKQRRLILPRSARESSSRPSDGKQECRRPHGIGGSFGISSATFANAQKSLFCRSAQEARAALYASSGSGHRESESSAPRKDRPSTDRVRHRFIPAIVGELVADASEKPIKVCLRGEFVNCAVIVEDAQSVWAIASPVVPW